MKGLDWLYYGFRMYDPAIGRFTGVDPLASSFAAWSPYNYTLNNPINMIDPDGRAPEWIDNGDGTYTAEDGDSAFSLAKDAGISNSYANALVESQLGANYIGAGGGLKSNVEVGDVVSIPSYDYSWSSCESEGTQLLSPHTSSGGSTETIVHQIGLTAAGGAPLGLVISGGIAWDSKGNVNPYGNIGFFHGLDITAGAEYTQSRSNNADPNFSIYSLNGTGVNYNVSSFIFDAAYGGDTQGNGNYGQNTNSTYTGGVSLGIPIGATRSLEHTKVFRLFDNNNNDKP